MSRPLIYFAESQEIIARKDDVYEFSLLSVKFRQNNYKDKIFKLSIRAIKNKDKIVYKTIYVYSRIQSYLYF